MAAGCGDPAFDRSAGDGGNFGRTDPTELKHRHSQTIPPTLAFTSPMLWNPSASNDLFVDRL